MSTTNRSNLCKLLAIAACCHASTLWALSVSEITDITPKVDENPVPVRTTAPVYPPSLRADAVSGIVTVTIVVDESGAVVASEVAKASNDDFKQPALDAVRKWKFKPAVLAGKAVKVRVSIPIRFTAND